MSVMPQILAHFWGDYITQSDWMAVNKSKRTWPCLVHVSLYTAGFLFVTTSWKALAVIGITHFLIDRFGLARYLVWIKNHLAPCIRLNPKRTYWDWDRVPLYDRWDECKATGYNHDRPIWLTLWLLIITDNLLHITINYFALVYL